MILNTSGWLKVTTNKDNIFYFHPETKTSQWLPPPHVAVALKKLEEEELREEERKEREKQERERQERERARRERLERKRKLEAGVPITEFDASKRARAGDDDEDEEDDLERDTEEEEEEEAAAASKDQEFARAPPDRPMVASDNAYNDGEDDDDEEWQRQIAEQMAAEAESEAEAGAEAEADTVDPAPSQSSENAPGLNPEEAKSSFMALLTSLNNTPSEINPMAPYDLEQSKFSSHSSFLAIPTRDREDIFNEWCKLRLREKRAAKAASSSSSASKPTSGKASAEANFLSLLRNQVRSTRTKFSDLQTAFSHHPHFAAYGRSDADRERLFKQHLIELGETKKRVAQKAEREFSELLSDRLPGNLRSKVAAADKDGKDKVMDVWAQAKKPLVEDKRYDAVGSSTRRFELFLTWAKGERRQSSTASEAKRDVGGEVTSRANGEQDDAKARAKELKRQQALRDRQAAVQAERAKLNRINRTAFSAASRQESLLAFQQLLLDAIVSPHLSYSEAVAKLARDPRFDAAGLTDADKRRLFDQHLTRLGDKEEDRLGAIFSKYAVRLDTHRDDVLAQTLQDEALACPPLNLFAREQDRLEAAYQRWDAQRRQKAEHEFQQMLNESAFVDFWGRFKKASLTASSSAKDGGDEGDEEDERGQTLVEMARKVDLEEIESVLRNDARFRMWKHVPETRRQWIREHLEKLAAPAHSVHK